jgi:hypothetical protein
MVFVDILITKLMSTSKRNNDIDVILKFEDIKIYIRNV